VRKVLFVCTGNLARSVMAEYLLQWRLQQIGVNDTHVESAGTIAWDGSPAADEAVRQMAKLGVDISAHRARRLTKEMIDEADLVVVMERYHRDEALSLAPEAKDKVVMLGEFLPGAEPVEIPDPYGGPPSQFALSLKLLRRGTEEIAKKLAG